MEYFSFQWHITDECDQRCKHCYIFSENTCKKPDAMTWSQIEDTFYNCLDFCEMYHRLPYFYLTGGDPILHPEFWKLLELLKEHEIPFTILGNPFHLNNEVCARLKKHGCQKYQLSLDGLRDTHDWFRNGAVGIDEASPLHPQISEQTDSQSRSGNDCRGRTIRPQCRRRSAEHDRRHP